MSGQLWHFSAECSYMFLCQVLLESQVYELKVPLDGNKTSMSGICLDGLEFRTV